MSKRWLWCLGAVLLSCLGLLAFLWATAPEGTFNQSTCDRIRQEGMTRAQVEALLGAQPFCVSDNDGLRGFRHGQSCMWGGEEEGGILEVTFCKDGPAAYAEFRPFRADPFRRLRAWLGR